jgi:hypothetical protein
MNGQRDDRLGLGSDGFVLVAGREQQCTASCNEKTGSKRWADDGRQEGTRKRLRVKTVRFHDVHKAGDGPVTKIGRGIERLSVYSAARVIRCAGSNKIALN